MRERTNNSLETDYSITQAQLQAVEELDLHVLILRGQLVPHTSEYLHLIFDLEDMVMQHEIRLANALACIAIGSVCGLDDVEQPTVPTVSDGTAD